MAEPLIRLVTRGDDSGACRSANRAVRDAFQTGILRNASVLAVGPAFDEVAAMLKDLKGLCIGLHACVTCEWHQLRWGPVLGAKRVPTLVMEDGTFFKDTGDLWKHEPKPHNDEIIAELKAQLARARAGGLDVKYLDEHMGFTWLHNLEPAVRDFAKAEGLIHRPKGLRGLPEVKGTFADPVEGFLARLAAAKAGATYLLVLHPAYDDAEMRALCYGDRKPGEIARERDGDRRLLMDPRVVAYCKAHGVQPIRFTDLGA